MNYFCTDARSVGQLTWFLLVRSRRVITSRRSVHGSVGYGRLHTTLAGATLVGLVQLAVVVGVTLTKQLLHTNINTHHLTVLHLTCRRTKA